MSRVVRTAPPYGGSRQRAGAAAPLVEASFRSAMRSLAASLTIVSARDKTGNPGGMVASAVISVSMEPPSMLIAVNRSASIHATIDETKLFCVNVLAVSHADIVSRFSRSELRDERFASGGWEFGYKGLPFLRSARSAVFCTVEAAMSYGTHSLYVGRVSDIVTGARGSPLLWFDGAHAELRDLPD